MIKSSFFFTAKILILLIRNFNLDIIIKELKRRFHSYEEAYVLHFDLTDRIEVPQPNLSLDIRKVCESDIQKLLLNNKHPLNKEELKERLRRIIFFKKGIPTCFVATNNNEPCLMVWMLTSVENEKIQRYFKRGVPWLKQDEVLFEFIFTVEAYRGMRIMHWAQSTLFKLAAENGFLSAFSLVHSNNKNSLKACWRIGWKPIYLKISCWRYFRRTASFKPISLENPNILEIGSK
jgi:hypothetical protein